MKMRVKINDQTFEVTLGDLNARPIIATVDGQTFEVYPEGTPQVQAPVAPAVAPAPAAPAAPAPAPAAAPKAAAGGSDKGQSVVAPIPGVIVAISVKEGEAVKRGQELCVLEAMKMKNSIRATHDGTVSAVKVAVGDHVQHSQVLVVYTE
ncbi:MAG TPA: biotin/lipoyl-containing protein [Longilinea sp.]|nr:biotin/lipoyl-containing protein [Longilinea sp.]